MPFSRIERIQRIRPAVFWFIVWCFWCGLGVALTFGVKAVTQPREVVMAAAEAGERGDEPWRVLWQIFVAMPKSEDAES